MIELNCSYEESKKILELGYNFKKISTDFVTKSGRGKLKRVNDILAVDAGIKITDINQCPHDLPDFFYFIESDSLIPIIPKAALQATLPDWVEVRLTNGLRVECGFRTYPVSNTVEVYRLDNCQIVIYFDANFEAFLWLHEHYPEELKEKFSGVMA